MNKIKTILLITVLLLLAGCEKYFFFPKQQLFYMPETCANILKAQYFFFMVIQII